MFVHCESKEFSFVTEALLSNVFSKLKVKLIDKAFVIMWSVISKEQLTKCVMD